VNATIRPLLLDVERCRERQRWVVDCLQRLKADRAVFVLPENIYYLTGFRPHRLMTSLLSLEADGCQTLVAPNDVPEHAAADNIVTYPAQWHATLRQEQIEAASQALRQATAALSKPRRVAVEFSGFGPHIRWAIGLSDESELVDLEAELWKRRRKKDPDELELIGRAIACSEAMYARAREIIEPGITEIEVYNQLHAAAVEVAGEPLTALGNDFQCNSPGGPPRPRPAQSGELFILDLGPAYRGYYADNCRTISADGRPTDEQQRAWEFIVRTLDMVEQTVRPGLSCRQLFEQAQSMLDEYRPGAFFHHLGHGFGLFPHEAPHLNPNWDDRFEEGDVFTAEPGLYGPELKAGIRLEQDYRLIADGVQRLTSFPLELA